MVILLNKQKCTRPNEKLICNKRCMCAFVKKLSLILYQWDKHVCGKGK